MVCALIYRENADIVGTDRSWEETRSELAQFIGNHPELRTQISLRTYEPVSHR